MNNKDEILTKVHNLVHAYKQGLLGGEKMPEDENPHLANVQQIVAERWADLLNGTELKPIDVHTPMWLWSRGKFEKQI